jgi:glycosyltransferase involved in cell wall biosynthesis
MMKIMIITDAWHPQLNGVVCTYEHLKENLEAQGHNVRIISPQDFKSRYTMPGYKEIDMVYGAYKPIKTYIEEYAPDTIHIATEGLLGWTARKYCLKHKIKFTTSYHTQFPDYAAHRVTKYLPFLEQPTHALTVRLIKKFHAPSSALLVTTQSMASQLKSWGVKTPIHPFTRGVDTALFYPTISKVLDHLLRPIALYVGRLAIEKNIEEFLEMPWQGSKVIIGHGPDENMLKTKYPSAHFMGKKTKVDLADHYRASNVFVFPSCTDTFGIVLIEALACGLPIAAHNAIGPKDIIINDTLGSLNDDLSKAALKALKNGTKKDRHTHVIENYTWTKATAQFLMAQEITQETIKQKKAA